MLQQTSLQNEHVMAAEWEKADNLQELDISATDLSKECLMDVLPRIPALQWLSAGQLDGMTDAVFKVSYLHTSFLNIHSMSVKSPLAPSSQDLLVLVHTYSHMIDRFIINLDNT